MKFHEISTPPTRISRNSYTVWLGFPFPSMQVVVNAGAGSARVASVDASARVANRRISFEFSDRGTPVEYMYTRS